MQSKSSITVTVTVCVCVCVCLAGQRPHEGAEHETTGGVHVQRAEAPGLRRGLPLAVAVHGLTGEADGTTSTPPRSRRKSVPSRTSDDAFHFF